MAARRICPALFRRLGATGVSDYVAKIRADGELASILESEHIDPTFARPAPKN